MKFASKTFLILLILCLWIYWDLTNANSGSLLQNIPSFKVLKTTDAVTAVPTSVAIVRSDDPELPNPIPITDDNISYTEIEHMVRRAILLAGGIESLIQSGDMVLLKPNIVDPEPAGSGEVTDVRVIKALVKIIDELDHGNIEIVIGEGSPRPMDYEMAYQTKFTSPRWEELWDAAGYQELLTDSYLEGINLRLSNLNGSPPENPWQDLVEVEVPGGGVAYPQNGKYYIHKDVLDADVFITVPVMKIHTPGITVALKNQIGLAPSTMYGFSKTAGVPQDNYQHKLWHGTWTDKEIVDYSHLAGIDYVVVDAIACLELKKEAARSNGIITNLVRMNTVIAGTDPVAVDHVCTRLMGLNPDDIEHVTLAEREGLGTNDPEMIEIVGADLEVTKKRFIKSPAPEAKFGQSNRTWLLNGPYSAEGIDNPIDHQFIQNEGNIKPCAEQDGWSLPVFFTEDHINLRDYYSSPTDVVSYAFSYFDTPKDQQAEIWTGCDEAMKIYLNGEEVYKYEGTRSFTSYYTDRINVNIKEGENTLLVKEYHKYSTYDFTLNICEPETDSRYDGNRVWGLVFKTESSDPMAIKEYYTIVPSTVKLYNNYPNPFNSSTRIRFDLRVPQNITLSVYDISGREIKRLFSGMKGAGKHSLSWDGKDNTGYSVASGIYIYRLITETTSVSKKLTYLN